MGHTVFPMRYVVYQKLEEFRKLTRALREPEKSRAEELINHVYQNISMITYANPLPKEIETSMIFSMLLEEKKKGDVSLHELTLLLFSLLLTHEVHELDGGICGNHDESNLHRLLREK